MSWQSNHISLLQAAVQALHKCRAVHLETVAVHEKFEEQTIWQGEVEVFQLQVDPKPLRCFAWLHHLAGKGVRRVAMLEKWPVVSAATAVRAAIALDIPNKTGDDLVIDPETEL